MKKWMLTITVILLAILAWTDAHYNRAAAYYHKRQYDKAWEDVHKAQSMEYQIPPDFLKALRESSGREE